MSETQSIFFLFYPKYISSERQTSCESKLSLPSHIQFFPAISIFNNSPSFCSSSTKKVSKKSVKTTYFSENSIPYKLLNKRQSDLK